MLSLAGMPQFITPASEEESLLFWLAGLLGYCFVYRAMQLESLREPHERRVRSEQALLQSEARFAIAFRASSVAIFLTTLE